MSTDAHKVVATSASFLPFSMNPTASIRDTGEQTFATYISTDAHKVVAMSASFLLFSMNRTTSI